MNDVVYAQMHSHSKQSVNSLSGEGVFHRGIWPLERAIMKGIMLTPEELHRESFHHGVRVVAITDHNTVPVLRQSSDRDGFILRGEEWGQKRGHSNFVNLNRSIDPEAGYYKKNDPGNPVSFAEAAEEARKSGAFITVNHPYKRDSWNWGEDSYRWADAIEIWNGPWNEENAKAMEKWQNLLESGLRIKCMAGSDFHVRRLFHIDRQLIAMRNVTGPDDFMEKLRSGSYSLARDTSSPVVFLEKTNGGVRFRIHQPRGNIQLVTFSGHRKNSLDAPSVEGILPTESSAPFVRAELWEGRSPLSFSNPVFL